MLGGGLGRFGVVMGGWFRVVWGGLDVVLGGLVVVWCVIVWFGGVLVMVWW